MVTTQDKSRSYKTLLGGLVILLMLLCVVVLVGQEYFRPVLEPLGLYVSKQGVFTDCKKFENRAHPYCVAKQRPADKEWQRVRERPGFNLSD